MEIKSYKKSSNNRYEVTLSNGDKYKIYDDLILKYELLINKEINKKKLDALLEENKLYDAYYKAISYVAYKMRSKKEIRDYLKKKDYQTYDIAYTIDKLVENGYINDEKYAKAYVIDSLNLSLKGPKKIKNELEKAGVSSNYIEKELDRLDYSTWEERIDRIISKKIKTNKDSLLIFKKKLKEYLIKEGYETEMIVDKVKNIDFNTDDIFLKEANKVWNKLSIKEKDEELKYKFKNKMYLKGFSSEQINKFLEEVK